MAPTTRSHGKPPPPPPSSPPPGSRDLYSSPTLQQLQFPPRRRRITHTYGRHQRPVKSLLRQQTLTQLDWASRVADGNGPEGEAEDDQAGDGQESAGSVPAENFAGSGWEIKKNTKKSKRRTTKRPAREGQGQAPDATMPSSRLHTQTLTQMMPRTTTDSRGLTEIRDSDDEEEEEQADDEDEGDENADPDTDRERRAVPLPPPPHTPANKRVYAEIPQSEHSVEVSVSPSSPPSPSSPLKHRSTNIVIMSSAGTAAAAAAAAAAASSCTPKRPISFEIPSSVFTIDASPTPKRHRKTPAPAPTSTPALSCGTIRRLRTPPGQATAVPAAATARVAAAAMPPAVFSVSPLMARYAPPGSEVSPLKRKSPLDTVAAAAIARPTNLDERPPRRVSAKRRRLTLEEEEDDEGGLGRGVQGELWHEPEGVLEGPGSKEEDEEMGNSAETEGDEEWREDGKGKDEEAAEVDENAGREEEEDIGDGGADNDGTTEQSAEEADEDKENAPAPSVEGDSPPSPETCYDAGADTQAVFDSVLSSLERRAAAVVRHTWTRRPAVGPAPAPAPSHFLHTQSAFESQRIPLDTIRRMAHPHLRTDVFVAMEPSQVAHVVRGAQTHDFRPQMIPCPPVQRFWIIESAGPAAVLRYMALITGGATTPPAKIDERGLGNAEFNRGGGGGGSSPLWAYELSQVYELNDPVRLADMVDRGWLDRLPERIAYVPPAIASQLLANLSRALFTDEIEDAVPAVPAVRGGLDGNGHDDDHDDDVIISSSQATAAAATTTAAAATTTAADATTTAADIIPASSPPYPPAAAPRIAAAASIAVSKRPRPGQRPNPNLGRGPRTPLRPIPTLSQASTASRATTTASSSSPSPGGRRGRYPDSPTPRRSFMARPLQALSSEVPSSLTRAGTESPEAVAAVVAATAGAAPTTTRMSTEGSSQILPESLIREDGRAPPLPLVIWDSQEED